MRQLQVKRAVPYLARLLHADDSTVIAGSMHAVIVVFFCLFRYANPSVSLVQSQFTPSDACWALSYLAAGSEDRVQHVIDSGACRRLVELLLFE